MNKEKKYREECKKAQAEITSLIHRRQETEYNDITDTYCNHLDRKIEEANVKRWNAVNNLNKLTKK